MGQLAPLGAGTGCGSPWIARDPRKESGNSRARLASFGVVQQSVEQNRESLQFSDWLQRKSLAQNVRLLIGHAVQSTCLRLRHQLLPDARCWVLHRGHRARGAEAEGEMQPC